MTKESKFSVTVHEESVHVEHKSEGHRYSFERESERGALGVVTITPNHTSEVFASSLEEEARSAAEEALAESLSSSS
jgi:hypothetical protein